MTQFTRAILIARMMGLPDDAVFPIAPELIRLAYKGPLSTEELDVALQPTGEDGRPVQFWQVNGKYYLDDPTFTDGPVCFDDLRYNSEIGLHVKK